MDYYGDMETVRETFISFINNIPFYGAAILCIDNEEIQGIIPRLKKRYLTYGMTSQADLKPFITTIHWAGLLWEYQVNTIC